MRLFLVFGLAAFAFAVCPPPAAAGQISTCDSNPYVCQIYEEENIDISAIGIAISGDVVLLDGSIVRNVFRIFNDIADTGGGTGLGQTASFYGIVEGNLPDPSTYSDNVIYLQEAAAVGGVSQTVYDSPFGDEYQFFGTAPEPASFGLLAFGCAGLALGVRRARARQGC